MQLIFIVQVSQMISWFFFNRCKGKWRGYSTSFISFSPEFPRLFAPRVR
jgi:hypothetical protein